MRVHVIENGKIANTIEIESLDIFPDLHLVDASIGGQIGDDWMDNAPVPSTPPPPAVPQQVTNGQAREALLDAGLLSTIEPAINAIPDEDARQRAIIAWNHRPTVERQSPFVVQLADALGLTDEQLDQLFIAAAAL